MIKTAEIQVPPTVDIRPVSGRFLLYNAFRNLSEETTIKSYPGWREDRNKRWLGGLTALGKVEGFEDIPVATVLRESHGMVQLLALNADPYKLDKAADYKEGWEFSERDDRILLNAVFLKKGKPGEIFVSYRTQPEPTINSAEVDQASREDLGIIIPLIRQLGFERMVDVISRSDPKANILTQFLTSPVWRHYNYTLDGAVPAPGGSKGSKAAHQELGNYRKWH